IADTGSLKLSGGNSHGSVKQVGGAATIEAIGGELAIDDVRGPLEIDGRNADIRLNAGKTLEPVLRINMTGGNLHVDGLRAETRVDGPNTRIAGGLDAPTAAQSHHLGQIVVT